jgi:hypothetical protein
VLKLVNDQATDTIQIGVDPVYVDTVASNSQAAQKVDKALPIVTDAAYVSASTDLSGPNLSVDLAVHVKNLSAPGLLEGGNHIDHYRRTSGVASKRYEASNHTSRATRGSHEPGAGDHRSVARHSGL